MSTITLLAHGKCVIIYIVSHFQLYVVRHAESLNSQDLSELGIIQAERARDTLMAEQLGDLALLLSSPKSRALQTASIISSGLGTNIITVPELDSREYISYLPKKRSDYPKEFNSYIGSFIERELSAAGLAGGPIIIVGHEPFTSTLAGRVDDLSNGEVVKTQLKLRRTLLGRHKRFL